MTRSPVALEFSYTRLGASRADTTQTFQCGNNLTAWSDIVITGAPGSSNPGITTITVIDNGTTDSIKISIPKTAAPGGTLLGRLKVTQP